MCTSSVAKIQVLASFGVENIHMKGQGNKAMSIFFLPNLYGVNPKSPFFGRVGGQ